MKSFGSEVLTPAAPNIFNRAARPLAIAGDGVTDRDGHEERDVQGCSCEPQRGGAEQQQADFGDGDTESFVAVYRSEHVIRLQMGHLNGVTLTC